MPAHKGHAKAGGRKKGIPNRTTIEIREAYQRLIELNTANMTKWLERIAEDDPGKAFKLVTDLSEFVLPKLARMEHTGDKENPVEVNNTFDVTKLSTETIRELISVGLIRKDT